jgi:hypothetical protein
MEEHDTTIVVEPASAPRVVLVILLELLLIFGGTYGAWHFAARHGVGQGRVIQLPPTDDDVMIGKMAAPPFPAGGLENAVETPALNIIKGPNERFGLTANLAVEVDGQKNNLLTRSGNGESNRTTIQLDGKMLVYGEAPGQLAGSSSSRLTVNNVETHSSVESTWQFPDQVRVTQSVELRRNHFTRRQDTCLIHYRIENRDEEAHRVGLSFSLDTAIDCDRSPLMVEGRGEPLTKDTRWIEKMPRFAQALERPNFHDTGLVYHLGLRLRPDKGQPTFKLKDGDPALEPLAGLVFERRNHWGNAGQFWRVTLRWAEQDMQPGSTRVLAFTYGLNVLEPADAELALSCHTGLDPRGGPAVIAWVKGNERRLRLGLPSQLTTGDPPIVEVPGNANQLGTTCWWLQAKPRTNPDSYAVTVGSASTRTNIAVPILEAGGP